MPRKPHPLTMWRYSVRWGNPYTEPPSGPRELAAKEVPAGEGCPAELLALRKPGDGYAVCLDFPPPAAIKPWSPERRAAVRRKNLARRVERAAPLFADELIARELAARPAYFAGERPQLPEIPD